MMALGWFLTGIAVTLAVLLLTGYLTRKRRFRLNLDIEGTNMTIDVGQTATGHIAPTDPSGASAPVTGVVWTVSPTGSYSIVPAADGLSAVYTATAVGTSFIATVTALNSAGATLTESAALPDIVVPVPVASALNLTVTTP